MESQSTDRPAPELSQAQPEQPVDFEIDTPHRLLSEHYAMDVPQILARKYSTTDVPVAYRRRMKDQIREGVEDGTILQPRLKKYALPGLMAELEKVEPDEPDDHVEPAKSTTGEELDNLLKAARGATSGRMFRKKR